MIIHTIRGRKYVYDEFGVLHQADSHPIKYDVSYVAEHTNKPNYTETSNALNHLRVGLIFATVCEAPHSICDVGYGDGSFLAVASRLCPQVYGVDPAGMPLPHGNIVDTVPSDAQVVTFWDSLEHMPELDFLYDMPGDYVCITVPDAGDKDLETWKHLRPDEHLHHFDQDSLVRMMVHYGWECRWLGHPEDVVRGGPKNILSAGFVRP